MGTELEQRSREDKLPEEVDVRLRRFDEWLTYLKDEASMRSPEVLTAMATKVHGLADYLERMADQARVRREAQETYSGSDPDVDAVGDGAAEDEEA